MVTMAVEGTDTEPNCSDVAFVRRAVQHEVSIIVPTNLSNFAQRTLPIIYRFLQSAPPDPSRRIRLAIEAASGKTDSSRRYHLDHQDNADHRLVQ